MNFKQSLKATAQQIIELSDQLDGRVSTWNDEKSAPDGGYTDRAGFIFYDEIELFADVYVSKDESRSLLRARLAWARKNEDDQELFTIITLDFNSDSEKTKAIIDNSNILTRQLLISLLHDSTTTPSLAHVSLESGKDLKGNAVGKRYEYSTEDLEKISEADQAEFLTTLNKAYDQIVSKI